MSEQATYYTHGLRRMRGRSTEEQHRVSSPLELIFDLVFAASFGVLGVQFASGIAEGHVLGALGGFAFGGFAIVWAWINYSWFASAFDTDDWLFRLLTMLQMAGVIVLAIGLPAMFSSIESGQPLDNRVMVAGYIVMRIALVCQWLRASRDPQYRLAARTYAVMIVIAQIGWVVVAWAPLDLRGTLIVGALCWIVELGGPILAERKGTRRGGGSTPWHADHIAERYSLLAIITLGETVVGTIGAAQEISAVKGWSFDAVVVIGAGIAMTFALWWTYFLMPSAPVLDVRRDRAFVWGYGHAAVFLSIAAVGAGLHLIGRAYDHHEPVPPFTVVMLLGLAVIAFIVSVFLLTWWLVPDSRNLILVEVIALLLSTVGIAAVGAGQPLWVGVVLVLAGPLWIVIWFEAGGWRRAENNFQHAIVGARKTEA